jgi:hypothetical protein
MSPRAVLAWVRRVVSGKRPVERGAFLLDPPAREREPSTFTPIGRPEPLDHDAIPEPAEHVEYGGHPRCHPDRIIASAESEWLDL